MAPLPLPQSPEPCQAGPPRAQQALVTLRAHRERLSHQDLAQQVSMPVKLTTLEDAAGPEGTVLQPTAQMRALQRS